MVSRLLQDVSSLNASILEEKTASENTGEMIGELLQDVSLLNSTILRETRVRMEDVEGEIVSLKQTSSNLEEVCF